MKDNRKHCRLRSIYVLNFFIHVYININNISGSGQYSLVSRCLDNDFGRNIQANEQSYMIQDDNERNWHPNHRNWGTNHRNRLGFDHIVY